MNLFEASLGNNSRLRTEEALAQALGACRENFVEMIDIMVEESKSRSPILTGNNRDSIESTLNERGQRDSSGKFVSLGNKNLAFSFKVYTTSGYGAYLELGTSRIPARPYFAPAFQVAKRVLESKSKGQWE